MAATTNNNDLVPKEALDQLSALDNQLKSTAQNMEALLGPVAKLTNELSKSSGSFKTLGKQLDEVDKLEKQYTKTQNEHVKTLVKMEELQKRIAEANSKEAEEVRNLTERLRQKNQETRTQAKEALAAASSIEVLRAKVAALRAEWAQLDMSSARFRELEKQIATLTAQLSQQEQKLAAYSRSIGNYAGAFSSLQAQIQQVASELPSAASGVQQFFSALLDKLPSLVGSIQTASKAQKEATSSGGDSIPVWLQMVKGIKNWQTALLVAGAAAITYRKEIGAWAQRLFDADNSTNILRESQKNLKEEIAGTRSEAIKQQFDFELLSQKYSMLGDSAEEKRKFIEQYRSEINSTGIVVNTLSEADNLFITNTRPYIDSVKKRAEAQAYYNSYVKILEQIQEKEDEIDNSKPTILDWTDAFFAADNAGELGLDFSKWGDKISYNAQVIARERLAPEIESLAQLRDIAEKRKNLYINTANEEQEILKQAGLGTNNQNKNDDDKQKALETAARIRDARLRIAQDEAGALQELEEQNGEFRAEMQKRIVDDEKRSLDERTQALTAYTETQKQLINDKAENQIQNLIAETIAEENGIQTRKEAEEYLINQIMAIRNKASIETQKIDQTTAESAGKFAKQRSDMWLESLADTTAQLQEIDKGTAAKLKKEAENYANGLINAEEYEKKKKQIAIDAERERFLAQTTSLEMQLTSMDLDGDMYSEEDKQAIREKIRLAELEFTKFINDEEIKEYEDKAKTEEEIEKEKAEKKKAILQAVFDFAKELGDAMFENQLNKLDAESEANQEWGDEERDRVDKLEEAGAISKEQADARKAAIDARQEEREKELSKKKAQVQKQQSIFQIILNTASAIMAAWATGPLIAPFVIPIIAAQGAAELALAIATPIPEYALGTSDHPGGLAIVGDGGRSEMIMTPGGGLFRTPAKDTLIDLPQHSVVVPSIEEAMQNLGAFPPLEGSPLSQPTVIVDMDRMVNMQEKNNRLLTKLVSGNQKDRANRNYYLGMAGLKHGRTHLN